jgi:hypothetical protein
VIGISLDCLAWVRRAVIWMQRDDVMDLVRVVIVHENSGTARPVRKVTSFSMVLDHHLQREDGAAFIRISEDIYDAIGAKSTG